MSWIDDLSQEALVCRDLHHSWKPFTAVRVTGGFERQLKCITCGTIKAQRLDKTGYILSSSFRYPAAYLRPKGLGRITAAENALLRLTHIKESM